LVERWFFDRLRSWAMLNSAKPNAVMMATTMVKVRFFIV